MNERMKVSPSSNVVVPILGLREFVTWTPGPSHSEAPRETLVCSVVGVLCFFVVINKLKKKKGPGVCGGWDVEDRPGTDVLPRESPGSRKRAMSCSEHAPVMASGVGSLRDRRIGRFLPPQHFQDHSS